ncbi:hypothetical protein Tco_1038047 [Tanacetum coccineum]
MLKSKSYNKHPTHRALHDALVPSLLLDEDDMDKQLEDQSTLKKRRRDNNDKDQVGSSKKGKSPSKSTKTDKSANAEETIHDVEIDARESVKEDVVDAENLTQADDSVPKRNNSTWFKMVVIERPESSNPEWHNESIVDDVPEQTWFNEMVNAEKDPPTFDDVIGLVIDFTNFTKNCLKKDRITKVDLEGPPFKLHKGKYRNYIELEYNMDQCYLALSDKLDWVNPEGDRIPHDISKPLPLHGAPGRLTIPVDFFFNKDLNYLSTGNAEKKYATSLTKLKVARYDLEGIEEMNSNLWSSSKLAYEKDVAFGITHWGTKCKLFYRARQVVQSTHKVYSRMKILSIIRISVDKQFGYGYLKEIVVIHANQKEYTFKEVDFPRLYLNDIKDMYLLTVIKKWVEDVQLGVESYQTKLNITMPHVTYAGLDDKEPYTISYKPKGVVYLNKVNNKFLMRANKVYKFGDGTPKKVSDKLDYMLHNFELGYNEGMPKRAWTNKDKKRTTSMLEKIEKTLLTILIIRSL